MIYNLNIEDSEKYDVVVCGGGMTGFAAAVTSAREGKKTLLIEKNGCLGGVATSGSVTCLLGGIDYEDGKFKFVTGGLFKELYYNLRKKEECVDIYKVDRNRSPHAWYSGLAESILFDNEAMKRELENLALDAGVELLYFSYVFDLYVEENKIKYILVANKSGNTAFYADTYIDCTGDADLAFKAGCKTIKGRDEDNLMTPATLIMNLNNVDTEKVLQYIIDNNSPRFREKILELRDAGKWTFPYDIFINLLMTKPGYHMINTIRQVGIDGTDGKSLTKGMIQGRRENKQLYDLLTEYFPGFENSNIANTADTIGIRETRRIIGDFVLSLKALMRGEVFEDVIALASYCFDLPDPKKPSLQPLEGERIKKNYTEIPYKCMLPDNINNLLVAGRSISVEREVLGPIRVMGPCIGMGQAAGMAASMAYDNKILINDVAIDKLKKNLSRIDCITDESQICVVRKEI